MIEDPTLPQKEAHDEVSALVRTLHETQQRLQVLTGGEVDAVVNPGEKFYLLHKAQEALRRSEERFIGAFEYAPIGVALVSPEGRWLKVNRALCELVGYSQAELLSSNFQSITHPDDLAADLEKVRETLAGNASSYQTEKRYVHAHGHFVTVSLHVSLVRDDAAAPSYFIAQIQDITERKRTSSLLMESRQRLALATESAGLGIWEWDVLTNKIFWDSQMYALYGIREEDFSGAYEAWQNGVHPDDRQRTKAEGLAAIEGNGRYHTEFRVVWPNGEMREIEAHAVLQRGDDDTSRRMIGVNWDITERKRNERAMRESEARFRGTFEQAAVGIAHVSPEGRFLRVNDKLCAIFGYPRQELLEMGYADLTLPEDLSRSHAGRLALLNGELPSFTTEKRYRRKDGTVVWVNLAATLERDSIGAPNYLISVFEDITARKAAENEVRFNEQRYRSLVEATTAIVWDTPASGEFEVEQPGWTAFTGQSFEELRGWGWLQAIHPDDRAETARIWSAAIASQSTYVVEHRLRAHDQTYRDMAVRAVPILGDDGNIRQWIGVHTDISERKKLEQQFLRAQRMESIGTLAGGIAHDLNNSLSPIIMSLDLMKLKFPDCESRELLDIVSTSAQRMADMVRQVLSFGRGVEGDRQEVQIRHLVRDLEKIGNDTFLKCIEVRTSIPNDLWSVVGDATQLHQVLLNLCVNARDAMPSGGTLTLSAENLVLDAHFAALHPEAHPGAYVVLQVEDTGTGIPPEIIDKIFDPFFTTKDFGKGTGLGLSASLAIVKSHGGFLRVYSEPGNGTTFKAYLPARTGTSPGTATDRVVDLPRGNGELILVVDDESLVRQVTQQTLEAFGYRVILAADGAEALALFATRGAEIAVVLTDMMMPIMDGPATIQVLRKLAPRLPIIAASGLAANDYLTKFANLGVPHFLSKPFTAETLLKVLKQILGKA